MTEEANVCLDTLRKAAHIGSSFDCHDCPAYTACPTGTAGWNNECIFDTAADLIESLSADLEQVKRERDAAVEALQDSVLCEECEHYEKSMQEEPCNACMKSPYCFKPNWRWRGVKEEKDER